jgi:hypothetical protein
MVPDHIVLGDATRAASYSVARRVEGIQHMQQLVQHS